MFFSFMFLFACADKSTDTSSTDEPVEVETPSTGTLALRFSIDEDYAAMMDEPPAGIFYGSFQGHLFQRDVERLARFYSHQSYFQHNVILPQNFLPQIRLSYY